MVKDTYKTLLLLELDETLIQAITGRLERTLIVDDASAKCVHNYGNVIYVKEYNGARDDQELPALARYLSTLKAAVDVRKLEKRHWRPVSVSS